MHHLAIFLSGMLIAISTAAHPNALGLEAGGGAYSARVALVEHGIRTHDASEYASELERAEFWSANLIAMEKQSFITGQIMFKYNSLIKDELKLTMELMSSIAGGLNGIYVDVYVVSYGDVAEIKDQLMALGVDESFAFNQQIIVMTVPPVPCLMFTEEIVYGVARGAMIMHDSKSGNPASECVARTVLPALGLPVRFQRDKDSPALAPLAPIEEEFILNFQKCAKSSDGSAETFRQSILTCMLAVQSPVSPPALKSSVSMRVPRLASLRVETST